MRARARRRSRARARILDAGVDGGQVPAAEDFLIEVRDDDEPRCPRCDAALERGAVAGRTSLWCPREQPVPS